MTGRTAAQADRPVPGRPFDKPWHAAAFAITVHLHDRGLFTWPDWADALGRALAGDAHAGCLDGSDDYYRAWLAALQEMLATGGVADAADIEQVMQAWTDAYLTTPHGQQVKLGTG